jgi:ubiquitin carboxyl-terminal hydrolase 8
MPPQSPPAAAKPKVEEKGVTGLANMGNTCYANATLQALRHNVELSAFFLENRHEEIIQKKPTSEKTELVKGYADLLRSLWSAGRPAYVRPTGFWSSALPAAAKSGYEHFLMRMQHDSHEFLSFMLDQLHEGLAEEVSMTIARPPPTSPTDHAIQGALEAWKQAFSKNYSPLADMLFGLYRQVITCQTCHKESVRYETFNMLKVQVPESMPTAASLHAMIAEEFKEETIEGYACDTCKPTRTTATKKVYLWRIPRFLIVALKRFRFDGRKIQTPVAFCAKDSLSLGPWFSPESPEKSRGELYSLFGTVDHHGVAGGGHYTAQAVSPLSGKWWHFDDESTLEIKEPQTGSSTYILFFKPSQR